MQGWGEFSSGASQAAFSNHLIWLTGMEGEDILLAGKVSKKGGGGTYIQDCYTIQFFSKQNIAS
jgi:hypothetical protein